MAAVLFVLLCVAPPAFAQSQSEEVEPRVIGERGTILIGMAGSLTRVFSSEDVFPGGYTIQVDGQRFLFEKIAVRAGLVGSGAFGGEADPDDPTPGTAALEVVGGAMYYFTPRSLWSLYGGADYRTRVTRRIENDPGSVTGIAGLAGALSSRLSFFLEGGYGVRLRRGDEGELLTRIVGQAGVRFKF